MILTNSPSSRSRWSSGLRENSLRDIKYGLLLRVATRLHSYALSCVKFAHVLRLHSVAVRYRVLGIRARRTAGEGKFNGFLKADLTTFDGALTTIDDDAGLAGKFLCLLQFVIDLLGRFRSIAHFSSLSR